jgi:hypothetical protein
VIEKRRHGKMQLKGCIKVEDGTLRPEKLQKCGAGHSTIPFLSEPLKGATTWHLDIDVAGKWGRF